MTRSRGPGRRPYKLKIIPMMKAKINIPFYHYYMKNSSSSSNMQTNIYYFLLLFGPLWTHSFFFDCWGIWKYSFAIKRTEMGSVKEGSVSRGKKRYRVVDTYANYVLLN